jgi:hypothetical protein
MLAVSADAEAILGSVSIFGEIEMRPKAGMTQF